MPTRRGRGLFLKTCTRRSRRSRTEETSCVTNTGTLFFMYIKFCRSYGGDKKDEASENVSPESKLSVELERGKGKQTEGNTPPYRAACLFLTIICLILLLVVIILSMKLQTGSTVCPERVERTAVDRGGAPLAPQCSHDECLALFPTTHPDYLDFGRCPVGWLPFGESCFFLSTFRLSWNESQKNCSAGGGTLAVITSQKLQNFLIKKGRMLYWIGLRRKGATWTWVDNTVLQESYWANVPREDCGILNSRNPLEKNWLTSPCEFITYFICQKKH